VCYRCYHRRRPASQLALVLADIESELERWRAVRDSSHDNRTLYFVAMTYVDVLLRVHKRLL